MTTPVSSIEPSFAPLWPGSYRAAREAEDPVIRTRRMGEALMCRTPSAKGMALTLRRIPASAGSSIHPSGRRLSGTKTPSGCTSMTASSRVFTASSALASAAALSEASSSEGTDNAQHCLATVPPDLALDDGRFSKSAGKRMGRDSPAASAARRAFATSMSQSVRRSHAPSPAMQSESVSQSGLPASSAIANPSATRISAATSGSSGTSRKSHLSSAVAAMAVKPSGQRSARPSSAHTTGESPRLRRQCPS